MANEEVWKSVVGYEGFYEVSNLGKVRGLDRVDPNSHPVRGKTMLQTPNHKGYMRVSLCMNGKSKKHSVHTLVMVAFDRIPKKGEEVRHLDGNNQNNAKTNLCWGTKKANWEDRRAHGTASVGSKHPMATIDESMAKKIKEQLGKRKFTALQIAEQLGVKVNVVRSISAGVTWRNA